MHDNLEQAFQSFTRTSVQLETAYRVLEERVAKLSAALAHAQDERLVQLAEKEKLADRLQGLLETLPAGVVVLDGKGIVQDCNPGAKALLGKELTGHRWTEIIAERFAMEGDGAGEFMLRDGREVAICSRPLQAGAGHIVLVNDVTETRRLQKSLARRERLSEIGQMNARLAHQLRTPLATAVLYASQLGDDDASPRNTRYTRKILDSLRHLERMVNDMLQFAGGGGGESQRIPVNELFAEVAAHLESQLGEGIVLEFGAPGELSLWGQREALVGALLNLATNAIECSESGVHIVMSAVRRRDDVVLSVSDDGPGIPPELRTKVFDPFFTTRGGGTGLGLAVVASVARAHAGHAEAGERPGGGAVVSIVLPVQRSAAIDSGRAASSLVRQAGAVA